MSGKKAAQATVAKKKAAPTLAKKSTAKSAKTATSVAAPAKAVEKAKKALAVAKNAKEKATVSTKVTEVAVPAATGPLAQKWTSLFKKADTIESKPYNMKQSYSEKTAIVHKVLGWGYIMANRNDRLEVLFKDGIKYLISNYK